MATIVDLRGSPGIEQGSQILNMAVNLSQNFKQAQLAQDRFKLEEQRMALLKQEAESAIALNTANQELAAEQTRGAKISNRISGVQAAIMERLQPQLEAATEWGYKLQSAQAQAGIAKAETDIAAAQSARFFAMAQPMADAVSTLVRLSPNQRNVVLDNIGPGSGMSDEALNVLRDLPQDLTGLSTDQVLAASFTAHRNNLPDDERADFDAIAAAAVRDAANPMASIARNAMSGDTIKINADGSVSVVKNENRANSAPTNPTEVVPEVDDATQTNRLRLARDFARSRAGSYTTSRTETDTQLSGSMFGSSSARRTVRRNFTFVDPNEVNNFGQASNKIFTPLLNSSSSDLKKGSPTVYPPVALDGQFLSELGMRPSEIRSFKQRAPGAEQRVPQALAAEQVLHGMALADDPVGYYNQARNSQLWGKLRKQDIRWLDNRAARYLSFLGSANERIDRSMTSIAERFSTNDTSE